MTSFLRAPVALAAGALALGLLSVPAATPAPADATVAGDAKRCHVGAGVSARQVIVVRSSGADATVKACRRTASGAYVVALGPFKGHVGRNGVVKRSSKREGDGRTPGGVYRMRGGFGVYGDPGVEFPWFRTDRRDRWVDDPTSRYYNLRKRAPASGRWSSAERLRISPAYDYAQVIGYNEKRVPYRGSAIFLHVDTGVPTAGCVSLKRKALLKILRWQQRGAQISIRQASTERRGLLTASVDAAGAGSVSAAVASRPPYYSSSRRARKADLPYSWRPGCPVGPKNLRVLRIRFWSFDQRARTGTLVVHRSIARTTRAAFGDLYRAGFPVRRMRTIDHYRGSDDRSMRYDNTSAFNCRLAVAAGPPRWSNHAYGKAIDINPRENPYVFGGQVLPEQGAPYVDRSVQRKGMIRPRGVAVRTFTARGFRWGGVWADPDYQHFDRR